MLNEQYTHLVERLIEDWLQSDSSDVGLLAKSIVDLSVEADRTPVDLKSALAIVLEAMKVWRGEEDAAVALRLYEDGSGYIEAARRATILKDCDFDTIDALAAQLRPEEVQG